jgi:hypothetical protein
MRLLVVLVPFLAAASTAAADVAAPRVSANWSGYAVSAPGVTFRDVAGTWTQPRASCVRGYPTASGFWVGLGGYAESARPIEQVGTAADCDAAGRARYRAWWQLAPGPRVEIPLRIAPGDRVTGAVLVSGRRVTVTLKNVTRKTRFSKTFSVSGAPDVGSAEWIAETPFAAVPLTNFGVVAFTHASAIGNGHAGTIDDPAWQATPIALDSRSSNALGRFRPVAQHELYGGLPTGLTADGSAFAVAAQVTEG